MCREDQMNIKYLASLCSRCVMLGKHQQGAPKDTFVWEITPPHPCPQSPYFWMNQMLDFATLIYTAICRIPKFNVRIASALFLMKTGIKII